jgi:hypothetical protein
MQVLDGSGPKVWTGQILVAGDSETKCFSFRVPLLASTFSSQTRMRRPNGTASTLHSSALPLSISLYRPRRLTERVDSRSQAAKRLLW